MQRYFIHMAYEGTNYHGWQVQPNSTTVQEVLEKGLSTLLRREIQVTGAGRTDTGVHAASFYAHFDLQGGLELPADQLVFKLNRFLPEDIVIFSIREVESNMHARFSATSRTYHYHISRRKPLFRRNYCLYLYGELDLEAIHECCHMLLVHEDFTSFSKLHTDVKTNNCDVVRAEWMEVAEGYRFEITADRFLRNMVRSIVGTLMNVGQGKISSMDFEAILEARDRSRAGQSAPAEGLFLVDITYPEI